MEEIHTNISQDMLGDKSRHRDQIDLLRSRLNLLDGKDKVLMVMHMENGNSFRQIARLLGVSEARIARRIHRLTERLIEGEYIACLRNRDRFSELQMAIAKDYFLTGLSMERIAVERHSSRYRVRQTLKEIQSLVKGKESEQGKASQCCRYAPCDTTS